MGSAAFTQALTATGYLLPDGSGAPGLTQTGEDAGARLRAVLSDGRVGLQAEAVFSAQSAPTAIFKDAGYKAPSKQQIAQWHEAAWNIGVAPLLWIVTPTDVRLYDCYASPISESPQHVATEPLDVFSLQAEDRLRSLDAMCGRYATETGAFWSSAIGQRIDRRHRVDRVLLDEINALEDRLTSLPPANGRPLHLHLIPRGPRHRAAIFAAGAALRGGWHVCDRRFHIYAVPVASQHLQRRPLPDG